MGERILVLWHTEDEGCQLIVSDTLETAKTLWERKIPKYKLELSLRRIVRVRIVPCPTWIALERARWNYEQDLFNFQHSLQFFASTVRVLDEESKAPAVSIPGFVECTQNPMKGWEHSCDDDLCMAGYVLTPELLSLFERKEVRDLYRDNRQQAGAAKLPIAQYVDTTDPTGMVVGDFGHHSKGIQLVDEVKEDLSRSKPILFFYNGVEEITDHRAFLEPLKKLETEKKVQEDRHDQRRAAQRQIQRDKHWADLNQYLQYLEPPK